MSQLKAASRPRLPAFAHTDSSHNANATSQQAVAMAVNY